MAWQHLLGEHQGEIVLLLTGATPRHQLLSTETPPENVQRCIGFEEMVVSNGIVIIRLSAVWLCLRQFLIHALLYILYRSNALALGD